MDKKTKKSNSIKIPIIFYHRLFNENEDDEKYSIQGKVFQKHLQYLSDNHFKTLLVDDIYDLRFKDQEHGKIIAITFDDGSSSDYSIAFPLLKGYGFFASFFVTTGWVDTDRYMTWHNLSEMALSGMSIQSHSVSHALLSDLNADDIFRELHGSKKILEMKLNRPVKFLSLPGGSYTRQVLRVAESAGYKGICTSKPGMSKIDNTNSSCMELNRFLITRQTSFDNFKAIVNGDQTKIMKSKLKYIVSSNVRRMIGTKNYYAIWSKLLKRV